MTEPTTSAAPPRRLQRSRTDRVIAGVAGGLGDYFGIDPLLVRIAFVVLTFAGGSGILIYIVAWLLMPEPAPGEQTAPPQPRSARGAGSVLLGSAIIALGIILLIDQVVPWFDKVIGPITLVVLGVAVLLWGMRR